MLHLTDDMMPSRASRSTTASNTPAFPSKRGSTSPMPISINNNNNNQIPLSQQTQQQQQQQWQYFHHQQQPQQHQQPLQQQQPPLQPVQQFSVSGFQLNQFQQQQQPLQHCQPIQQQQQQQQHRRRRQRQPQQQAQHQQQQQAQHQQPQQQVYSPPPPPYSSQQNQNSMQYLYATSGVYNNNSGSTAPSTISNNGYYYQSGPAFVVPSDPITTAPQTPMHAAQPLPQPQQQQQQQPQQQQYYNASNDFLNTFPQPPQATQFQLHNSSNASASASASTYSNNTTNSNAFYSNSQIMPLTHTHVPQQQQQQQQQQSMMMNNNVPYNNWMAQQPQQQQQQQPEQTQQPQNYSSSFMTNSYYEQTRQQPTQQPTQQQQQPIPQQYAYFQTQTQPQLQLQPPAPEYDEHQTNIQTQIQTQQQHHQQMYYQKYQPPQITLSVCHQQHQQTDTTAVDHNGFQSNDSAIAPNTAVPSPWSESDEEIIRQTAINNFPEFSTPFGSMQFSSAASSTCTPSTNTSGSSAPMYSFCGGNSAFQEPTETQAQAQTQVHTSPNMLVYSNRQPTKRSTALTMRALSNSAEALLAMNKSNNFTDYKASNQQTNQPQIRRLHKSRHLGSLDYLPTKRTYIVAKPVSLYTASGNKKRIKTTIYDRIMQARSRLNSLQDYCENQRKQLAHFTFLRDSMRQQLSLQTMSTTTHHL